MSNYVDQSIDAAKEITVAILQNSKELTFESSKLEETGEQVAKLFLTIYNAVKEASKS